MAEYLTKPQFARRLGISRSAVNYAIKKNRINTIRQSGVTLVDWHTGMEHWIATCTNPHALRKVRKHLKAANRSKEAETETGRYYTLRNPGSSKIPRRNNHEDQSAETLLNKPLEEMTSSDASELIVVVKAKKAQLEYEKEAKKCIEVDIVEPEMLDIAAKVKGAMLSIPDRISTSLEGLNHQEIHNKLTTEIKHALTNLSQSLKCIEKLKDD